MEVQYLFNIHTHPKHTQENGKLHYNFFSAQDIKSLISSNAIMTGLVTDKLLLLVRSNKTPDNVEKLVDSEVNPYYVEHILKMGLYQANFSKKAYRYKLIQKS